MQTMRGGAVSLPEPSAVAPRSETDGENIGETGSQREEGGRGSTGDGRAAGRGGKNGGTRSGDDDRETKTQKQRGQVGG